MDFARFLIAWAEHDATTTPVGIGRVAVVADPDALGYLVDAFCIVLANACELFTPEPIVFGLELGKDVRRDGGVHVELLLLWDFGRNAPWRIPREGRVADAFLPEC